LTNPGINLATRTSLSPIRRRFAPGFVNYKKGCTRLAAASDKVYQLLAHGRWFSPGTPAASTTKTGHHDIAEILLKVTLSTINQSMNPGINACCRSHEHWCQRIKVLSQYIYHAIRTYYHVTEQTSFCPYSLMPRALQRSNKYQLYCL
jgi:hypothetical protein